MKTKLLIFLILAAGAGYYLYAPYGRPSIINGLPSNIEQADKAFNARLNERYVMGSSEDALKHELKSQGFVLGAQKDGTRTAHYTTKNSACSFDWAIDWDANARGEIFRIAGHLRDSCV